MLKKHRIQLKKQIFHQFITTATTMTTSIVTNYIKPLARLANGGSMDTGIICDIICDERP